MVTKAKQTRYLIISDELSVEQKIVQAAHVAACIVPTESEASVALVVTSVDTGVDLLFSAFKLREQGITFARYYDREYHGDNYPTALITEVVDIGSSKHTYLSNNLTLYKFSPLCEL